VKPIRLCPVSSSTACGVPRLTANLAAQKLRLTEDRNERLANPGFAPEWD